MNFYALSALFNTVLCAFLAIALIIKPKKPRTAVYFTFFNLAVLIWSVSYFFWQTTTNYDMALFWVKMLMLGAIFTSPTLFLFSAAVAKKEKQLLPYITISFLVNIVFVILHFVATPYFIAELKDKLGIPLFPTAGKYFWIFLVQWFLWFFGSFYLLYTATKTATNDEIKSTKSIFYITVVVLVFAGIFNYFLWYDIPIPPITTGIVSIYGIIIVPLLFKGKFYRTHTFYFELFASLVVLLSILQIILSDQIKSIYLNLATLIIILISSFIMIKAGNREQANSEKISNFNQTLNNSIQKVLNSIDDAAIIINKRFNILHANAAALLLFNQEIEYPKSLADFCRTKINRSIPIILTAYFEEGQKMAETEILIPDNHRVKITFSAFSQDENEDSTIMIIKKI